MATRNENGGLYFMVGALLVAVVGMGLYFYSDESAETPTVISNTERTIERTVEDAEESGSSFELNVDEEGFSASSESDN